jgi:hypothetical protein
VQNGTVAYNLQAANLQRDSKVLNRKTYMSRMSREHKPTYIDKAIRRDFKVLPGDAEKF